ncbi:MULTISPECIES: hypothetical protein [Citricoccus]|uniref:hypothetical protein n=1 Tax=Citricoccus TaxID=169133 RepID=UPI000255F03C|nr:hypothetical protein [Citricoccus sp. CH26A]
MPHLDPGLLELRIHGIRNTPSHHMLRAIPANVQRTRGDQLAGFSIDRASEAGHRVEAYSWGRLARFTGFPALGRLGDSLVRAVWFTLAPFGLANTAYWSRHQLGKGPTSAPTGSSPPATAGCPLPEVIGEGRLAGTVRLLGLALTLLFVSTAATVALDMAAVGQGGFIRDTMAGWPAGARTAVLTVLPVLALSVIVLMSALARTRYLPGPPCAAPVAPVEPTAPADHEDTLGHAGDRNTPSHVLARSGLWRVGAGMRFLGLLHTAGALAWTGSIVALARADTMVTGGPRTLGAMDQAWIVLLAVGLSVIAVVGVRILRSQAHDPRTRAPAGHRILFAAGAAVLLSAMVCSLVDDRPAGHPGLGQLAADDPAMAGSRGGGLSTVMVTLGLAVLLVVLLMRSRRGVADRDRDAVAWGGSGPFVFSSLAVGFALLLSFSTVILAAWSLGSTEPPVIHLLFASGFTLLTGAALTGLAVQLFLSWRAGESETARELSSVRDRLVADAGPWAEAPVISSAARAVWISRRVASLLRRAEVITAWLAAAVLVGLAVSVVLNAAWLIGWPGLDGWWPLVRGTGTVGLWIGVVLVAAIAILSGRGQSRPAGLLWDLMCFLPTQAHPFGPPCYSERVVPEVTDRIEEWVQEPADGMRRVVLSAHSMGGVLAVCVLFHLSARGMTEDRLQRIGMLSYGSQLRRYFARVFPQVLGAQVLSIIPAPPPSADGRDPWPPELAEEVDREQSTHWLPGAAASLQAPGSLWWIVRDRWTNLHRPNDPLGFTVRYGGSGPAGGMDVQAEEFVRGAYQFTVATHQGYLESVAYAQALESLVGRLGRD